MDFNNFPVSVQSVVDEWSAVKRASPLLNGEWFCRRVEPTPAVDMRADIAGRAAAGWLVFGGVTDERLQLTEDTQRDGDQLDASNPDALKALPEVRK